MENVTAPSWLSIELTGQDKEDWLASHRSGYRYAMIGVPLNEIGLGHSNQIQLDGFHKGYDRGLK
jgi:hypothetical protein